VLVAGDTVTLHDLGSKNGTSVNGALLQGARLLAAGDRIRVGSVELEFRTGGVTTETLRL
jgi:pSer/pThr/pTyr-binding forkhead associated (FHA) protein